MDTLSDFGAFASKSKKVALIFRAINNPLRQKILSYLLKNPAASVTQIFVHLRCEQSVASQHLAILRDVGIVETNRDGKNKFYSIDMSRVKQIEQVIDILLSNALN